MSKPPTKQVVLSDWLRATYGLSKNVQCRLLRAYTNDVYEVDDMSNKFVLKVYGIGWRTEGEILWEVDLINHLSESNVAVAPLVQAKDGSFLQTVDGIDGRFAVLFEYAKGRKPKSPIDLALYRPFGRCIANLHLATDNFRSSHQRRKMDTAYLIDEAYAIAHPLLGKTDKTFFSEFAEQLKASIKDFSNELDWGVCHGDATFDNLHITNEGQFILYDFDSGGYCWRACDLQGWAMFNDNNAKTKQAEFLKGYQEVRQLSQANVKAAPFLYEAFDVWGVKIDLQQRVLQKGKAITDKYLSEQMQTFRERSAYLWN